MHEAPAAASPDHANKTRIEALTDGVFAIVMTLLVLDIRLDDAFTDNARLWEMLAKLAPAFVSYFISFAVLAMLWLMHHMFFHVAVRAADRTVLLLNTAYLAMVALVPFSARVLAAHLSLSGAVELYGANVFAIGCADVAMFAYVTRHPALVAPGMSGAILRRVRQRHWTVPVLAAVGMLLAPVWIPLSLFLYAFPIVLNLIPGVLGVIERMFRLGGKKEAKNVAASHSGAKKKRAA
jgi:uncharacterized membrane protein